MELEVEDVEDDGAPWFENLFVFKLLLLWDALWFIPEPFPWLELPPAKLFVELLGVTADIGFIFKADSNYLD